MKFLSTFGLVAALTAGVAVADNQQPIMATDAQVEMIRQQIVNVVDATQNLSNGIWCFSGLGDSAAVVIASTNVLNALQNGTTNVNALNAQVSFSQSLSILLERVTALNMISSKSIDGIIARKPAFVDLCLGKTVLAQVTGLYTAAQQFQYTIGTKFNSYDRRITTIASNEAINALKRGVAAYQDQNTTADCVQQSNSSALTPPASCKNGIYTGAASFTTALPITALTVAGVVAMALL